MGSVKTQIIIRQGVRKMNIQMNIRPPEISDAFQVYKLANEIAEIDVNSEYFYHHMIRTHGNISLVFEADNRVQGCCLAYPLLSGTVFIWQFFLSRRFRGKKIGNKILEKFLSLENFQEVQTTIADEKVKHFFKKCFTNAGYSVSCSTYIDSKEFGIKHPAEILIQATQKGSIG